MKTDSPHTLQGSLRRPMAAAAERADLAVGPGEAAAALPGPRLALAAAVPVVGAVEPWKA